jgi:peptidoglycan LD-endopeptidase LytH
MRMHRRDGGALVRFIVGAAVIVIAIAAALVASGWVSITRSPVATQPATRPATQTSTGDVVAPVPPATPVQPDSMRALHRGDSLTPPQAENGVAATPSSEDLEILRGELIVPIPGLIPSAIPKTFDEMRGTRHHAALDILAPRGTIVRSAAPGRVLKLFTSVAGGLMVYAADSTDRFILMYAHLDRYAPGLTDTTTLSRGEVIGYVGTTGNAPPDVPHLHFGLAYPSEINRWWTGTPIDPWPLLQR